MFTVNVITNVFKCIRHRSTVVVCVRMAHTKTSEIKTDYEFLGKSGLKVSNVCLGTLTFGKTEGGAGANSSPTQITDEADVHKLLDRFVELGGNFIDTANIYGRGQSEIMIGNWLTKQKRDDIVLATKVRFRVGERPNDVGLSRRHIMQSVDDSLKRLQTDYIDLYQTHLWDPATPIEETYRALDDLVRCGKVRYIGVSNLNGWRMQKVVDMMKHAGMNPVVSIQQQYSLLCRYPEFEEFEVCANEGIGVIPWSPLKGGLLTGKYKRGLSLDSSTSRIGHVATNEAKLVQLSAPAWSKYSENEAYWKIIEKLSSVADHHGKTVTQVALRWLIQKNIITSVLFGATSIQQLEENMGASSGWSLTLDEMEQLDEVSDPGLFYPHEILRNPVYTSTRINPLNPQGRIQNIIR